MKNILIDGIEYAPVQSANGTRAVVVIDRGWIFAGNVTDEGDDIRLAKAVHVFKWTGIGFTGAIAQPDKVDLRPMESDVLVPKASIIFKVPVDDSWGV